jgi:hypothetical protein
LLSGLRFQVRLRRSRLHRVGLPASTRGPLCADAQKDNPLHRIS